MCIKVKEKTEATNKKKYYVLKWFKGGGEFGTKPKCNIVKALVYNPNSNKTVSTQSLSKDTKKNAPLTLLHLHHKLHNTYLHVSIV